MKLLIKISTIDDFFNMVGKLYKKQIIHYLKLKMEYDA
jgi:hypothetical protein